MNRAQRRASGERGAQVRRPREANADVDALRLPPGVHLNPGSVPEARQLAEVTNGLAAVRKIITRETIGAISPRTQLFAVNALMQRHHDAIASLIGAAVKRNDRVMAADDMFQLILSLVGHATTAGYWLQLAHHFRRLPVEKPPPYELSVAKSREQRERVLARIRTTTTLAFDLMSRLRTISPPELDVRAVFDPLEFELICDQIHAYISARTSASGGTPIPEHQFGQFIAQLQTIRSSERFASWPAGQQNALWLTLARVHENAGHHDLAHAALRQRLGVTPIDDDTRPRLLTELLGFSVDADERLELVEELRDLPDQMDLGPVFSRERIGRLSVLHDTFWSAADTIPTDDPKAVAAFEAGIAGAERWLFGRTLPLCRGDDLDRVRLARKGTVRLAQRRDG